MISVESSVGSIRILTVEKGWLAVDKPAGLTIHNEPGKDLCSIINAAIVQHTALSNKIGSAGEGILQPVHRLDRMTSGIVLLADRQVLPILTKQFAEGAVKKKYLAIVHGILTKNPSKSAAESSSESMSECEGRWTWPLTKKAGGRKNPEGRGKRVGCETRFRVLETTPHYTLLECELITGRKHQIRRHAKMAGHALVGDERYGTLRSVKFLNEQYGFHRLGLHAVSLEIHTPDDKKSCVVITSKMPPEMAHLLENDWV